MKVTSKEVSSVSNALEVCYKEGNLYILIGACNCGVGVGVAILLAPPSLKDQLKHANQKGMEHTTLFIKPCVCV